MKKNNRIILTVSVICAVIGIGIALPYFLVKPRITCCNPDLFYTSYYHPNNSSWHFSVNVFGAGAVEATIANMSLLRFTNTSGTYYPSKVFGNGTEINFPLIIKPEEEINITLELDWRFTIGSVYTLTLEYDYGKAIEITFLANKVTYTG